MENEIKNSEMYINKKVGKETGFSTPSNYFDDLEDAILGKVFEDKLPNETGFKVPENYFKTLEEDILNKVSSSKKETKVISLRERVLKIIPFVAAASIVLFIGLNSFVFETNDEFTLDSLSENDIEYWLESNTLNSDDMATVLQDDIEEENGFYFMDIEDESIEEYMNTVGDDSLLEEID
jgi:hypothetical protein